MMSPANWRFVIAYVSLVALPTIACIGILKQGCRMSAPLSVDGAWKLELNSSDLATLVCGKPNSLKSGSSLAISQSGSILALDLKGGGTNASGTGVIEGEVLKASLLVMLETSNDGGCIGKRLLRLVATLHRSAEWKRLTGKLSVEACSSCADVEFYAIWESPKTKRAL
jgi:hypothetical protein